jgi:hypothetical protein
MNLYKCFEAEHNKIKTSINLKRDFQNRSLVNAYYPSYQNLLKLEKIIRNFSNKKNGSFIINGAYGTGKSYFTLMLTNLLMNDKKEKEILLNKFEEIHSIKDTIKNLKDRKYITVFFNDIFKDFYYALISGINLSIQENNLEIDLNSIYLNIVKKINYWEKNQVEIYEKLKCFIEKKGLDIDEFKEELLKFNIESLADFKKYYKEIFYGEEFEPYDKSYSIIELLIEFEEKVKKLGYDGVLYLFDEFGRYLESSIEKIDVKEVQDIGEYCNDFNTSSYFVAITHKDIFQYSKKNMSKSEQDEWNKVSGRFLIEHLNLEKSNIEDIIKQILRKNKNFEKYKKLYKKEFENYKKIQSNTLPKLDKELLLEEFFPLNYLVLKLLPSISQKFAQNERTIFSFILSQEENSLKSLIDNGEQLIGLSSIFDYFKNNFRMLDTNTEEYKIYNNVIRIIQRIKGDNKELKIRLIKSLGIIYLSNLFFEIEPSKEILMYDLNISEDLFEKIQEELIEEDYLIYKRNFKHYKLNDGDDINIDREVENYIDNKLSKFDFIETLNKYLEPGYFFPLKYNQKYNITRFLKKIYIDVSQLDLKKIEKFDNEDGHILFMLNIFSSENYLKIVEKIKRMDNIVIYNKFSESLNIEQELKELKSIEILSKTDERFFKNELIEKEIITYKEELVNNIWAKLKKYFNLDKVSISYPGCQENNLDLIEVSCDYLENKYPNYIEINYEMINKHNITPQMKKVRENILENMLLNKFRKSEFCKTYFENTGAENSVARILLKNENLIIDGDISFENSKYKFIYEDILKEIKSNKKDFSFFYDKYCTHKSNYGLRKGIFSYILAIILVKNKNDLNIIEKKANKEIPFNTKLINEIEKNPENYSLQYIKFSKEEKEYIKKLEEIFKLYIPNKKEKKETSDILQGIKIFTENLNDFIFENILIDNSPLKKILSGIFSENNSKEFLLKRLPEIYQLELLEIPKHLETELINIEIAYKNFKEKLSKLVIHMISSKEEELVPALNRWKEKNKDKNINNEFSIYLLNLNEKSSLQILRKITEKVTGKTFEYWKSLEDIEIFEETFKNMFNQKETKKGKIVSIEYNGKKELISIDEEQSQMGKLLKTKLEQDIKNMGLTISNSEKRKILFDIFLKNWS